MTVCLPLTQTFKLEKPTMSNNIRLILTFDCLKEKKSLQLHESIFLNNLQINKHQISSNVLTVTYNNLGRLMPKIG